MDTAPAGKPPTPAARPPRERRAPDIAVHDHGSIVLLRAVLHADGALTIADHHRLPDGARQRIRVDQRSQLGLRRTGKQRP